MPHARFFFDAGSGGVLWPTGTRDQEVWGYPARLAALPIGAALRTDLERLIEWYDTSLNWDYPPDPGPWREPECHTFNAAVRRAIDRLRSVLGPDWEITDEFDELHEEPDLHSHPAM